MKAKFNLKDYVEETITGFTGRITAIAFYVDREPMYLIENIDTTNRPIDYWYGESRIELLGLPKLYGGEEE